MAGTLTPAWFLYFTTATGEPLSGGKIYTYITGTSTPTTVYQDATLATPWSNPIIIPSDGKVTIYQGTGIIKAVVYNSADVLQDTFDPISPTSANSGLSIIPFGGTQSYPIVVTALPSGTAVSTLHPGTSIWPIDSGTLAAGTYILVGMLQAGAAETVTASLVNLSQGSPDTAIVSISSTNTAGEWVASGGITFATAGTARQYAVKTKTATGVASYGWNFDIVRS